MRRFRTLVKTTLPLALLAAGGLLLIAQAPKPAPKPAAAEDSAPRDPNSKILKALYVGGGCCHDYDTQKLLIKAGLEARANIEVDIVHQGGTTTDAMIDLYKDPDWAAGYDVVLHHECFAAVKDKDFVDGILKPHRDGVPAVVIHCAMHCYRVDDDRWFKFCGVRSHGHGKHYPHEVLNVNAAHPVMETFPAGWWSPQGELYHVAEVYETTTPLATSKDTEQGQDHLSVWANDYEGTRVFGTTLGHHNEVFEAPEFMELLTRGTLWAAGKLDDDHLKPFTPKSMMKPVDLARGKAATASSEETTKQNFAPKAFDGDPGTRWCASGASFPQWLQVDLEKPQKITGVAISWESKNRKYDHTISTSLDGRNWSALAGETEARYVKVDVSGSNGGGWASIWDFEVHGTEMVEVKPELAAAAGSQEAELLKTVKVPADFEATIFAAPPAVNYPTFVCATPEGVVFVSQDKNGSLARDPMRGSILRCEDLDGDGRADQVNRFVANVDSPRGLEWDGEWLYCLRPPHLSRYRDTDGDNVADEEQLLVEGIAFGFADRPADHTSNGITLGVDGWIYCAIGDFGFMNAKGTDGTELQFRGGGVVRVRPDGSGLHLFSRGTRNIYEIAVGPTLEAFTRDNTNDGGGWDVRLHHFTGLDHHGYPSLYMNFADEIVQPLRDYGGGSGVGSVWIDEPGYPEGYQNVPCTVDWGPGWVYVHDLDPYGATFTEVAQREFVNVPRATDATIAATGELFVSSWKGGQFKYDGENVGYVARVQPQGHAARAVPDFKKTGVAELVALLEDDSFTVRRFAQFELLRRGLDETAAAKLIEMVSRTESEASAAAGLFTLHLGGKEVAPGDLAAPMKKFPEVATRFLAEVGKPVDDPALEIVASSPAVRLEIVRWLAATADGPDTLLDMTADDDPVVRHTAINALAQTEAVETCLASLDNPAFGELHPGAFGALQQLHRKDVVDGLLGRLDRATGDLRSGILKTLARLYFKEGEWAKESWGTRPDTSGPYYKRVTWEESERVAQALRAALADAQTDKAALLAEISRNQIDLDDSIPTAIKLAADDPGLEKSLVDLLIKKGQTPREAIPVLTRAATSEDRPGDLRLNAARCLAKADDEAAFKTAFDLSMKRDQIESIPHVKNSLRDDVFNNPGNENRYETILGIARGDDEKAGTLAWGLLLKLSDKQPLAPETKGEIETAIKTARTVPAQLTRLLNAIGETKHGRSKDIVVSAAADGNPAVAKAAQAAAKALKIELGAPAKPAGPLIATLKPGDVLNQVEKIKGDPARGEILFTQQICATCHTVKADEPLKGPFLGNIAQTYKRRELAEMILEPNKSLAQGFKTNLFELNDGSLILGFVSKESAGEIEVRDATGKPVTLKPADIKKRTESEVSIMPPGLVNNLSVEDLAALLAYLESKK